MAAISSSNAASSSGAWVKICSGPLYLKTTASNALLSSRAAWSITSAGEVYPDLSKGLWALGFLFPFALVRKVSAQQPQKASSEQEYVASSSLRRRRVNLEVLRRMCPATAKKPDTVLNRSGLRLSSLAAFRRKRARGGPVQILGLRLGPPLRLFYPSDIQGRTCPYTASAQP